MGKYEYIMKCAEIRKLTDEKKYQKALEVVNNMNIDKMKQVGELNIIANVYIKNEEFEAAREVLFRIYEKLRTRRLLYQLVYLSLKCNILEDAENFYEEYLEFDKNSSDRLILKYCIDKAKGVDRSVLIQYLEQLKKEDYMEEWAYELAKLYHKEGMTDACVSECSDIILWFGEGLIVEKSKLLKLHYVEGLDIVPPKKYKVPDIETSEAPEKLIEEPVNEEVIEESRVEINEEIIEEFDEKTKIQESQIEETIGDELFVGIENDNGPIHVVITENESSNLMETVRMIAKELFMKEILTTSQIAKISAEKLNVINLEDKAEKLINGCLLIEQAGDLDGETVAKLIHFMEEYEKEIVVILEDNEDALNWLFKKNRMLKNWFRYKV